MVGVGSYVSFFLSIAYGLPLYIHDTNVYLVHGSMFVLYKGAIGLGNALFGSTNSPSPGKSNVVCSGDEDRLAECSSDGSSNIPLQCETSSAVCQGT